MKPTVLRADSGEFRVQYNIVLSRKISKSLNNRSHMTYSLCDANEINPSLLIQVLTDVTYNIFVLS